LVDVDKGLARPSCPPQICLSPLIAKRRAGFLLKEFSPKKIYSIFDKYRL
jgi:hypothetical protein